MKYSKIIATGRAFPEKATTNEELAQRLAKIGVETSDEWITTRTGIKQRYLVEEGSGLTTSNLAAKAARQALERAQMKPEDVDFIIVATTTPDHIFPSTACSVQKELGCRNAAAFDVQAVCSGFVYSLTVADALIRSGSAQRILVIGSEVLSRLLDWKDRTTCVLFGDGAGAVLLEASDTPGILGSALGADGNFGPGTLAVDARVKNGEIVGDPFIRMDGKTVFRLAVEKLSESAEAVLKKAGIAPDQVDLFVPHQANLRIMSMVAKKLHIDPSKMMISLDKHGNTSAASVPLSLDKAITDGRVGPGSLVLLQGVGGGFTWGSVLLRL